MLRLDPRLIINKKRRLNWFLAAAFLCFGITSGHAQEPPSLDSFSLSSGFGVAKDVPSPHQINQQVAELIRLLEADGTLATQSPPIPQRKQLPESLGSENKPAPLQKQFETKTGQDLAFFGHESLGTASLAHKKASLPPDNTVTGSLPAHYILGVGDQLRIALRGGEQASDDYVSIPPSGQIILNDLPPLKAAGQTLVDIEADLQNLLDTNLRGHTGHISIESIRQISVTLMGQIAEAGLVRLSAADTVLDAIYHAGGVTPAASLRSITVRRGNSTSQLDLYPYLVDESPSLSMADLQLRDGDIITIPVANRAVAVMGDVAQPSLVELPPEHRITLSQALNFSGWSGIGSESKDQAQHRLTVSRWQGQGEKKLLNVTWPKDSGFKLKAGDVVTVTPYQTTDIQSIQLRGAVNAVGSHAVDKTTTLSSLLTKDSDLAPNAYRHFAFIYRPQSQHQGHSRWQIFSPHRLIDNPKEDILLRPADQVLVLTTEQISLLMHVIRHFSQARWQQAWDRLALEPTDPVVTQLLRLVTAQHYAKTRQDQSENNASHLLNGANRQNVSDQSPEELLKRLSDSLADLATVLDLEALYLLRDNGISLTGSVAREAIWPIAAPTSWHDLARLGGFQADSRAKPRVEVTRHDPATGKVSRQNFTWAQALQDNPMLYAGDSLDLRVAQSSLGHITLWIGGEVIMPGRYTLRHGDKLSDLINRAGGLTRIAYPAGAVFTRQSERIRQRQQYQAIATQLEASIAVKLSEQSSNKQENDLEQQVGFVRHITSQLRTMQPVGRIVVEADPRSLRRDPGNDILLHDGDAIYFPRVPHTVHVMGEVMSPTALMYHKDKIARDYVLEAGGPSFTAYKSYGFIVYPDGSAAPLASQRHDVIPAGSTIILPPDPYPSIIHHWMPQITTILTNLANVALAVQFFQSNMVSYDLEF